MYSFLIWLLSLDMVILRFILLVACISSLFLFFILVKSIPLHVYIILFIYLLMILGWFPVWASTKLLCTLMYQSCMGI